MRTIRKFIWWLLSPFAWGSALVARHARCRVLSGPFAGLRYPPSFVCRLLFHGPYQVGSFELELHPAIERIVTAGPATVVNVGAAEGYYAVGLAVRLPRARVVGFELDPALRAAAARLAALNGVGERIELRGLCTESELAALAADEPTCVIMDCEGAEAALADPDAVPWLARATLLIELHPAADAGIRSTLEARFADSHALEPIASRIRRASEFDRWLQPIRGLRRIDRELLVAEFRDGSQDWLLAIPR
jgi:hypothetical protein